MKVGDVCSLLSPRGDIKLIRHVKMLSSKSNIGGVLVLLDGDAEFITKPADDGKGTVKEEFCPATTAYYSKGASSRVGCVVSSVGVKSSAGRVLFPSVWQEIGNRRLRW